MKQNDVILFDFYLSVGSTKLTSLDYPFRKCLLKNYLVPLLNLFGIGRELEKGNCNGNKLSSIKFANAFTTASYGNKCV